MSVVALSSWAAARLPTGGRLDFVGRLDNREALLRSLPAPPPLANVEDADLLAHAYGAWGIDFLRRLLGSFALLIWDPSRGVVILARDPLGGRTLNYSLSADLLVLGRDPTDVLDHPKISDELDPAWLAAYFALQEPADGRTTFARVRELPPGHWLEVGARHSKLHCYWSTADWARPLASALPSSPGEVDEELRHLLRAAVRCRLQGVESPALLMSGGLDSVPIAAAAREILGPAKRLLAVSWVFPNYPRADESELIASAAAWCQLDSICLPCDDQLPLGDFGSWPLHPATPEQNPYRRFHQRAYAAAAKGGARVMLSGMCGDQLWSGAETWLGDALRRGHLSEALREITWQLRHGRLLRPELPRWLRAARQLLRPASQFPWLTATARQLVPPQRQNCYQQFPRPQQARLLLGSANGHGFAVEAAFTRRAGIELRYPLRDRRLIQLALALPTSALYARGIERVAWRRAVADSIPERIVQRQGKATFVDLFARGIYQRDRPRIAGLLFSADAMWPAYVRSHIVRRAWENRDTGFAGLQLWLALSLELWLRNRARPFGGPTL